MTRLFTLALLALAGSAFMVAPTPALAADGAQVQLGEGCKGGGCDKDKDKQETCSKDKKEGEKAEPKA